MAKKVERLIDNTGKKIEDILNSPRIGWRLLRYLSIAVFLFFIVGSILYSLAEVRAFTEYLYQNPNFFEEFLNMENIKATLQEGTRVLNSSENMIQTLMALVSIPFFILGLLSIGNAIMHFDGFPLKLLKRSVIEC